MVPKLTEAGIAVLLKAISGASINFTKIQLGNGEPQIEKIATQLNNPLLTVPFTKIEVSDNHAALMASFDNCTIENGFRITEVGFFVEDPDNENNEILYALGLEDSSTADFVPDNTNRILEMEFEALIFVGEAENVTAAINSSLVYTTKEDFDKHTLNSSNPHNVTKEQIGLDKVPNVSTNDQTPTYTEAQSLSNLSPGEKLSTIMGKLAFAVRSLIAHINNKENPHSVTAKEVGAAAADHTHSAADINSGVLPIARGGTGTTTASAALANLGGCRMATGSYTGTGQAGQYNQNKLTFDFVPRVVIVQNERFSILMVRGINKVVVNNSFDDSYDHQYVHVTWNDRVVAWYHPVVQTPNFQLNEAGVDYSYIAIGC